MRSTTGIYFEKLDHVRAVAAFLVFTWHFIHAGGVPTSYVPSFWPASILEEGHTGVSIFFTLSGYLFAKLLDGRTVCYPRFILNRAIRLLPLLIIALALWSAVELHSGTSSRTVLATLIGGAVLPLWPNGAWSIAVEIQYYVLLPLVLYLLHRNIRLLFWLMLVLLVIRVGIFQFVDIQRIAYATIIGRLDQFILGVCAFALTKRRPVPAALLFASILALLVVYQVFNLQGGIDGTEKSSIWLVLMTFEGGCYAVLIAYYDQSSWNLPAKLSKALAFFGTVSYSVYLLHPFYVAVVAPIVFTKQEGPPTFPGALAISTIALICFLPIAWISYQLIEKPFLKYRVRYFK
ncbi:MAG: acyltransferase [Gammaproteobacteria bacterium]|nr:acyltransferase [Gammaproteobacteria bacterium]MBU1481670.1 acyltransferase [Gammaproteobacteria bacterium]